MLDRPNPIDGAHRAGHDARSRLPLVRGPVPDAHAARPDHGRAGALDERAARLNIGRSCALHVVPMTGWDRRAYWDDLGLVFVCPRRTSPPPDSCADLPRLRATSRARTSPRGAAPRARSSSARRPSSSPKPLHRPPRPRVPVLARRAPTCGPPASSPTFQKHAGRVCLGVFVHPVDRAAFNPVRTGLALLRGIVAAAPRRLRAGSSRPTNTRHERLPIDVIAGGPGCASGRRAGTLVGPTTRGSGADVAAVRGRSAAPYLLY